MREFGTKKTKLKKNTNFTCLTHSPLLVITSGSVLPFFPCEDEELQELWLSSELFCIFLGVSSQVLAFLFLVSSSWTSSADTSLHLLLLVLLLVLALYLFLGISGSVLAFLLPPLHQ